MDHRYQGPLVITKNIVKGLYRLEGVEDPDMVVIKISGAHLKPHNHPDEEHVHVSKTDETCSALWQTFW